MSTINILKAKLVKGETLEVSYTRKNDVDETEVKETHKVSVHQDLKNSFAAMAVHLALLSEFISPGEISDLDDADPSIVNDFEVRAFSLGGTDDDPGVVLTGHKVLSNKKTLGLNAPFTRFDDAPEIAYKFIDDLIEKIDAAKSEVQAYIMGAKVAVDPQGSLFAEQENGTS